LKGAVRMGGLELHTKREGVSSFGTKLSIV
jgi:hypothetical protein